MIDPSQLLTSGARRLSELIANSVASGRQKRAQRLQFIKDLHAALLSVDADYRRILLGLLDLLEELAAEPDRASAMRRMREATRSLRQQREVLDHVRAGLRLSIRNLMLFTDDAQTRHYLWAVAGYLLDEDPGLGFPANVESTVQRLLDRDIGAVARTPSSVILDALEDGSTPDQVIAVIQTRRAQMKHFLEYAIDRYTYLLARELR